MVLRKTFTDPAYEIFSLWGADDLELADADSVVKNTHESSWKNEIKVIGVTYFGMRWQAESQN